MNLEPPVKFDRQNIESLYQQLDKGSSHPVYLLFGERFLCQQVAQEIVNRLLPDEATRATSLLAVEGDREIVAETMTKLRTFSLFGGRQLIQVKDSRLFLSRQVGKNVWNKAEKAYNDEKLDKAGRFLSQLAGIGGLTPGEQLTELSASQWQKFFGFKRPTDVDWTKEVNYEASSEGSGSADDELVGQTLEAGIPETNHLLILAETVDKRKKLFKVIDSCGVVVDLAVDTSFTSAAKKGQEGVIRDLVSQTFREMGKKPGPRVMEMILDRVGFHPVAAVREAEKLALYCGDNELVSQQDVNMVTSQSREEALFELNDAVGSQNLERTLVLLLRLLQAGTHALVIVATMRNLLRKLMFIRALQESMGYRSGLAYGPFQKNVLAQLKDEHGDSEFLKGHPFVIYKAFQQAEKYDLVQLRQGLTRLLDTEYKLKSAGSRDHLLLENFFFRLLR